MRYAVGDVHGHRDTLRCALTEAGLIGAEGDWSGGSDELWFVGDLMDRGPDGVGVVSDVMRWQRQAVEAGGLVGSVLGNHEVLALGVRRFAHTEVPGEIGPDGPRSFALSWLSNGGRAEDQDALTDDMADWIAGLPAVVVLGDHLLMHSDTRAYLEWGGDVDAVNRAVSDVLHGDDITAWWELWRSMTMRFDFLGPLGAVGARDLLERFGAHRIVHGHSLVSDLRRIDPASVTEPWSYADGLALAVDGGIYAGGPCLVVPLQ